MSNPAAHREAGSTPLNVLVFPHNPVDDLANLGHGVHGISFCTSQEQRGAPFISNSVYRYSFSIDTSLEIHGLIFQSESLLIINLLLHKRTVLNSKQPTKKNGIVSHVSN